MREPRSGSIKTAVSIGLVLTAACSMQHYRAEPIAPDRAAAAFEARTLQDPALAAFARDALGQPMKPWPPAAWDYRALSLAALYFNPDLEAARARLAESQAQMLTAGARPNPGIGLVPGVPSPYLLTLELSFPLETAGKRGYRMQAARDLDQAARLELALAAWTVRGAVRTALVDELTAARSRDLLRAEVSVRAEQVQILKTLSGAGEIPVVEAAAAEIELSRAHTALGDGEQQAVQSRAALAAAIGISVKALEAVQLDWPDMDSPPSAAALPLAEIERSAVLNRLDVRSALARYAAAESSVQLEIAKQYPDFDIGPGYTYEEKRSYFTLGLSATLPLLNRNQGPIAEAEARRREAGAAFLETQSRVILKSQSALEAYAAALERLAEASRLAQLQSRQCAAVRASVQSGERGRLDLDDAEIAESAARRERLAALAEAQHALGDLEDAVERPLARGDELPAIRDLDAAR